MEEKKNIPAVHRGVHKRKEAVLPTVIISVLVPSSPHIQNNTITAWCFWAQLVGSRERDFNINNVLSNMFWIYDVF